MFQSIRWRIGIPFVLLILVSMLGLGTYLSIFTWQTYLDDLKGELAAQAGLIAQIIEDFPL